MAIFKCKICGGTLNIEEGSSVAVCEYCGTKQTLPRLDSEKKINLYDRADHFRRNNDYDKAMSIYESILNEDTTDAEAYWSILLCRYGVEYVEDPVTHRHVPTINRAQFTSVLADEDYKSAIHYADAVQREIYEQEAQYIDEVQKGILEISAKEEAFDVFICYKETDANGRRTQDSVLATELYHGLTNEGFHVFFSRITLEDKLGTAYEPYIFAVLNSAKVMVVIGTKPEYLNAVWVKNEWSRYLALIKSGAKKTLIPAYRDMDPNNMPDELSHLQAQDMSKLGFMQDLIHGVKKIVGEPSNKHSIKSPVNYNYSNPTAIIDRALLMIEDGENDSARELLTKVMDIQPTNPLIYIGKLLIEQGKRVQNDLSLCDEPLDTSPNYQRAIRFANPELKSVLVGYNRVIIEHKTEMAYQQACKELGNAISTEQCEHAKMQFDNIISYRNSSELSKTCSLKCEDIKKKLIYKQAVAFLNNKDKKLQHRIVSIQKSISLFQQVVDYNDATIQIDNANRELYKLNQQTMLREKKKKIALSITLSFLFLMTIIITVVFTIIIPGKHYNDANEFFSKNHYQNAYNQYIAAGSYSDAKEKAQECLILIESERKESEYQKAVNLRNEKKWEEANTIFKAIKDYKDSSSLIHNHNWNLTEHIDPSCLSNGYNTYVCTDCGDTKRDIISALSHSWKDATCTSPKTCTRCGITSGSALGHTTENAYCSRCGILLFQRQTYSGYGPGNVSGIDLPYGTYIYTFTHTGSSNFVVYCNKDLLVNEIGRTSFVYETTVGGLDEYMKSKGISTTKYFNITDADGYWSITIEAKK